ncbi:aminotransferase class I/II-fold pyridoxal phosphate-dependent enzyme, partial [Mycolicibacterium vaccae]|nr:aminotransferase class I/II-fold pyridoxal phosphate-dependent enzyme [Mycolicibacterium vaccae]
RQSPWRRALAAATQGCSPHRRNAEPDRRRPRRPAAGTRTDSSEIRSRDQQQTRDDPLEHLLPAAVLDEQQRQRDRAGDHPADELRAIVDIAARHHARVIADEIHAPLVYDRAHVPAASVSETAADTVITLLSASKGWNLPGLVCAQVVLTNPGDIDAWDRINMLHTMGVSTVGIRANVAADSAGAPWLDELLVYLRANRDHLARTLPESVPGLKINSPEATYMSWVDFRALNLPAEPAEYLAVESRTPARRTA